MTRQLLGWMGAAACWTAGCAAGPAPIESVAGPSAPPVATASADPSGPPPSSAAPPAPQASTPAPDPEPVPSPAAEPRPPELKRYVLSEPKVSFTAPSAAWHEKDLPSAPGVSSHGFERDPVFDATGHGVLPFCTHISMPTEHTDVIKFSMDWRLRQPFEVDSVFSHESSPLKLKNAVGYWGKKTYGGDEHTLMIVHALFDGRGLITICDSTTSVIDQVKPEFEAFLAALQSEA